MRPATAQPGPRMHAGRAQRALTLALAALTTCTTTHLRAHASASGLARAPPRPLPAPAFGTTRLLPANILDSHAFSVAGGPGQAPVVAAGPVARFASDEPTGYPAASESVLSTLEFPGDVEVDVHIVRVARHVAVPAYEASPALFLAAASYNQTAGKGPRTHNFMKLHSTINDTS